MAIEITNVGIKGPKGDTGSSGAPLTAVSGVPITYITPANTFVSAVASDNGAGKTLLTSSGSHGLTAADAVGANIYVISGTGWTAGLKKILSIDADNGNQIAVDVPFSSQGSPTINLGTIGLAAATISIPPLSATGIIIVEAVASTKNSAASKYIQFSYAGASSFCRGAIANSNSYRLHGVLQSRGNQSSQVGFVQDQNFGGSSNTILTSARDSSINQNLIIQLFPEAANPITLERYYVLVYA